MAVFAATDCTISVGGTDLSDHAASVTVNVEAADLDTTAFGDSWNTRIGGLKSGSVGVTFHQDFASSSVDDTVWSALGTSAAIVVKPTSGSVSTTNPSYSFSALITDATPLDSSVGDLATVTYTWPIDGAVTKATS